MITRECKNCLVEFQTYQSRIQVGKGKFCSVSCGTIYNKPHKGHTHSKETKRVMRLKKLGRKQSQEWIDKKTYHDENHPMWKGDEVGYVALHTWVRKKLGTPDTCTQCRFKSKNNYKMHWANISGEYKRDVKDFIRLCASCHKKYDLNKIKLCV